MTYERKIVKPVMSTEYNKQVIIVCAKSNLQRKGNNKYAAKAAVHETIRLDQNALSGYFFWLQYLIVDQYLQIRPNNRTYHIFFSKQESGTRQGVPHNAVNLPAKTNSKGRPVEY